MPWNKWAGDEDADGEFPEEKLVEPAVVEQRVPEVVFVNTREKEPREFYISKADAEKHGYTRGCGGCSSCSGVWDGSRIRRSVGGDSRT